MKYSTKERIEKAMINYLKNPSKKSSIMPSLFFTKFPMKKAINDENLTANIKEFINFFDIKKRLTLEE
jgi:hypothetical protein